MKVRNHIAFVGIGVFAVASVSVSCGKDTLPAPNRNNPPEQVLPDKPFNVRVFVEEPGIESDSSYIYEGLVNADCDGKVAFTSVTGVRGQGGSAVKGRTWTIDRDVVELVLTPWNGIRFEVSEDVNASSSTAVADIANEGDLQHYVLKSSVDVRNPREIKTFDDVQEDRKTGIVRAIEEGWSDIRFWNGTPESGHSITIRMRAANHIPVEGFEFALDGKRYALVETEPGVKARYLPADAYLCHLPCIARPDDEWYQWHKYDYDTEEIYPCDKFSTIEFIGTIPRNATPDNRIRVYLDALSTKCANIISDYENPYSWNERHKDGFRWIPYMRESESDSYQSHYYIDYGGSAHQYFPADIRYLRAKTFNYLIRGSSDYVFFQNYHFRYSAAPDGRERFWWGIVQNDFYRP
ncbi:MAG: hypothetical protein MJY50_03235 [Bacteroidales bacterium]|nr:hypothetical protein [Bacteroidales bacterium]